MPEDKKEETVEKTPEQKQEETNARVNDFLTSYGELVKRTGIDFASYPMFVPNPNELGSFKIIVQNTPVDISNQPKKSPFVAPSN